MKLPLNIYLQWIYNIILSVIISPFIFWIILNLFLYCEKYCRFSVLLMVILGVFSFYEFYKITSNTLIVNYDMKFYNYNDANQDSSMKTIKIMGLSTSGTANDIDYEIYNFEMGNWTIDYRNSISFINAGKEALSSPLIYHINMANLGILSHSGSYNIPPNMVLCIEKSPESGILMIEFNGKRKFLDCYSPFVTKEYIYLNDSYTISRCDFSLGILLILFIIFLYWGYKTRLEYINFIHTESNSQKCLRTFIVAISTFMLCGQKLLLNSQGSSTIFIKYLIAASIILVLSYILFPYIIILLKKIYLYIFPNIYPQKMLLDDKFKIFFTILSIELFWYLIFNPGGINLDIIAQWEQTQGLTFYSDWHPLFHTMLIKIFTLIDNNIYIYFFFQIVFITLIITFMANFLIENGLQEKIVIIAVVFFLALPNNEIITEATKDVIGTYSYIWIILLTTKLFLYGLESFWSQPNNIIQTLVALFFSMNIRHSQQSVVIVFLLILIIQMIQFKVKQKNIVLFLIGFLSFNSLIMNGIKHYTDYHNYTKGLKYVTPISDMANLAVNNLEIDESTAELIELAMPIEEWKTLYNPYYPSSALLVNNVDFGNIFANLSLRNVLSLYIKNFIKYPLEMIRARLLGSHIIWGISQGNDNLAKNQHTYLEVRPNPFGIERSNTILKRWGKYYVTSYQNSNLIDILLWRSGIHIIFLLICLYIICKYSEKKYCLILMPCIIFTSLLFIALPAPNYRYIYYLLVTSFFMFLLLPLLIKKE